MAQRSDFEEAERRIDEIAEELAHGNPRSRGNTTIELRKLCGHHRTVPGSYKLEGVTKDGDIPKYRHPTGVTEIWKGRYNGDVVALKVLRVPRDDPQMQGIKSRFCKEVVLMMQLKHENILPFYGVSTTVSDFCLVFPWYGNGNIMDYLKGKPYINRFDLLSGVICGLLFLHKSRLVHGALRPSHILIDDNGAARLATAGRSSVVAVPGTSIAGHSQSGVDGDVDKYRYWAPEIQWRDDGNMDKILITNESDVYGMAMVAYEAGEMPQRPSGMTARPVWEYLEKCWSRDPQQRPPIADVYSTFSGFRSLPQVVHTPDGRSPMEELPGRLKLQVQSIKLSLDKPKQQQFSVRFKYGNKDHTTSPTKAVTSDEHIWDSSESWLIQTSKQHHGQPVSIEVLRRTSAPIIKRVKVCATGSFSLLNGINKDVNVKLEAPRSTEQAVLKILVTETF